MIRYFREYLEKQDKIDDCSDLDLPQSEDEVKIYFLCVAKSCIRYTLNDVYFSFLIIFLNSWIFPKLMKLLPIF